MENYSSGKMIIVVEELHRSVLKRELNDLQLMLNKKLEQE
jgi:hypothetical protein